MVALCRFASGQHTFNDMARFKEIVEADRVLNQPKAVIEELKCPECEGPMISRTGKYGVFWGCKRYPTCNGTRDSMGRSRAERAAEKTSFSDMSEQDNSNDMYRFRR